MNKSVITNLVAILIILIGFSVKDNYSFILMTGIFAFSGSITNWLAVHMLFEKIPFLYGSGVILDRFQDIKVGIKNLILEELFSAEQINKFLLENKDELSEKFIDKIDFDRIFQGLVEAIEGSQLGGMLAMVGGRKALEPLKDPIIVKLKIIIGEIISENSGDKTDEQSSKSLIIKIETILDARLDDLTPKDIKRIIQKMIRDHLGWLVVWGGFFGGLLGLLLSPIAFNLL
ncbi:DUF445 domain-containing protein [Alphaproteobacteria bacterium]|jgi:uncharacterized membrane protein YheB (UPF0754 family)|nr:DUF445 domain-containing protein [Alphaproteobacteria bacterium]MDC1260389.1 DUF445 domain-containing protein [Pseudomonadota bacterium]|tara:strand:+ start:3515 stop:4207 length:693 start_codon:yes stop_codon:yes gene_type:complete